MNETTRRAHEFLENYQREGEELMGMPPVPPTLDQLDPGTEITLRAVVLDGGSSSELTPVELRNPGAETGCLYWFFNDTDYKLAD